MPAVAMPVKQLKGFRKIALKPGETNPVTFTLTPNDLYIFDVSEGRYRVPAGNYTVGVGGASDHLPLIATFTLTPADELPDLMLANIRTIPAFPKVGDTVLFVASILNRGTGPTPADKALSVSFQANGKLVAWSPDLHQSIPAGGMALVCGSVGPGGNAFWSLPAEKFTVQAEADYRHVIPETIESNNIAKTTRLTQTR
jgi:beta-glucosidase